MDRKTVGISLVVYNEKRFVPGLCDSIRKLKYEGQVIVFACDNHSSDGSGYLISQLLPDAIVYFGKENLGYAGGHNMNAQRAFDAGVDFLLVVNTDVTFSENLLTVLVGESSNDKYGVVAPIILFGNRSSKIIQHYIIRNYYHRGYRRSFNARETYDHPNGLPQKKEVNFVGGTALLIRREVYSKVGLFDASGFMYGEESDFCYRVLKANFKIVVTQLAQCYHYHDWSVRNKRQLLFEYYYIKRNKIWFFKKHKLYGALVLYLLREVIFIPIKIRWTLKKGGAGLLRFYYLGLWHGVLGRRGKASLML